MIDLSTVTDSREIIERINELEEIANEEALAEDEAIELSILKEISEEASHSPDWEYGESLVNDDYFTEYTKELIDDCYDIKATSPEWPYRHMEMDYEAAAEELKQDYHEFTISTGETYLIRI